MSKITLPDGTEITDMEQDLLKNGFGKSDFFENGLDSCVWSDVLGDTTEIVKGKQVSGVVASLVKKNILSVSGEGKEAYVYLTGHGKEVFNMIVLGVPEVYRGGFTVTVDVKARTKEEAIQKLKDLLTSSEDIEMLFIEGNMNKKEDTK